LLLLATKRQCARQADRYVLHFLQLPDDVTAPLLVGLSQALRDLVLPRELPKEDREEDVEEEEGSNDDGEHEEHHTDIAIRDLALVHQEVPVLPGEHLESQQARIIQVVEVSARDAVPLCAVIRVGQLECVASDGGEVKAIGEELHPEQ
jgi:hypothetical protein